MFYFAMKHAVSKDLCVFFWITLKFGKKNASYRHSEARKRAPYLPKILQMKPKGNEYGTSPRTHQRHRNPLD